MLVVVHKEKYAKVENMRGPTIFKKDILGTSCWSRVAVVTRCSYPGNMRLRWDFGTVCYNFEI